MLREGDLIYKWSTETSVFYINTKCRLEHFCQGFSWKFGVLAILPAICTSSWVLCHIFLFHFDMCFCCSICSCLCPSPVTVIGNFPPFLVLTYFPLCFSLCVIGLCIYTRWLFFDSLSFRLVSWSQLFSWFLVGLGLFLVPVFACFWSCSLHSVLPTWFCCVLSCKSCFFLLPLHFVPCSLWSSPTKPGCCFIPLSCLCQKSLRPQGNMSICGKRGIRCLL